MKDSVAEGRETTESYDLLFKGGRLLDLAQGVDMVGDLAIAQGRVAAMGEGIDEARATTVFDAKGKLVVPGLIDLHMHGYWGATDMGMDVDSDCLSRGVTTVVDAGSAGTSGFSGLRKWVIDGARCRVLAFVNLSSMGLVVAGKAPELCSQAVVDPAGIRNILEEHADVVLGVKARLSDYATGGPCTPYLKRARELADLVGTRLMVHIGDTVETLPEILSYLRPGDILSHCLTPRANGILDTQGRVLPQVWEAASAGVVMDAAHGRFHFGFQLAERAFEQGFLPSTISSDITVMSKNGPVVDLLTCMDKYLALGLSLQDVIARVTSNAAAALGRSLEFGALKKGMEADVTVLAFESGSFALEDATGEIRKVSRRMKPVAVARAGQLIPVA